MEKRYGEDAYFYYYPEKRGDLREIKMGLSSFDDNGLPFTFMLRVDDEGRPNVRVLIWRDSYRSHARSLAAWAQRVNISAGTMIDEGFTPLAGWREWHRVFLEEDYPTGDMIDQQAFDEDTAEAAADAVSALVEQLCVLTSNLRKRRPGRLQALSAFAASQRREPVFSPRLRL